MSERAVQPFPLIVGPTAGGKSALALKVAVRAGGEVISADAFQVYRGLDIASAKPTPDEQRAVRHHLIDTVEPTEAFTVHDWLAAAEAAIADIRGRGKTPVLVGGTHLYAKAFLEGLFEGPEADEALRAELRAMGLAALRAELERVDPAAASRLHPNDERRTVRALEVHRLTGRPISDWQAQWDREASLRPGVVLVGLDWPTEAINRRINARVRGMVEAGLVEETRALDEAGRLGPQAREALGTKQILAHLAGACTLEEAVEKIKIETRRFAKNQRTWLRRLRSTPGSVWIDAEREPPETWAGRVLHAIGGGDARKL
ncbi:MAG: tRNA (adenosine(37)-N6)-dimethylallyltransferase MiaA [Planctomycetota bacterium]